MHVHVLMYVGVPISNITMPPYNKGVALSLVGWRHCGICTQPLDTLQDCPTQTPFATMLQQLQVCPLSIALTNGVGGVVLAMLVLVLRVVSAAVAVLYWGLCPCLHGPNWL